MEQDVILRLLREAMQFKTIQLEQKKGGGINIFL